VAWLTEYQVERVPYNVEDKSSPRLSMKWMLGPLAFRRSSPPLPTSSRWTKLRSPILDGVSERGGADLIMMQLTMHEGQAQRVVSEGQVQILL
jgi:hypothetical protein